MNKFLKDESGATAIEYGLIAAAMATCLILIMPYLVNALSARFENTALKMNSQWWMSCDVNLRCIAAHLDFNFFHSAKICGVQAPKPSPLSMGEWTKTLDQLGSSQYRAIDNHLSFVSVWVRCAYANCQSHEPPKSYGHKPSWLWLRVGNSHAFLAPMYLLYL